MAKYRSPLAYFLDELPADFGPSHVPNGAKEVTIAKVRALDTPVGLGKRDQSGVVPIQRSRDKSFIRVQVLEARIGSATVGTTYDVYFGQWDREMIYPLTPDQLARDYWSSCIPIQLTEKPGSSGFRSAARNTVIG